MTRVFYSIMPVRNQSAESIDRTIAPNCSMVNVARLSFASTVEFPVILNAVYMVYEILFWSVTCIAHSQVCTYALNHSIIISGWNFMKT